MNPTAYLFDLDETLIPEDAPIAAGYLAVAQRVWGASAGAAEAVVVRDAVRARWAADAPRPDYGASVQIGGDDGLCAAFDGDHPAQRELRAFLPHFRATAFDALLPAERRGSGEALAQRWRQRRWDAQGVYPGARELLAGLRARAPLGLVTNGPSDVQRHKLAITGLADAFDVVVASCDVGVGKPDPEIFRIALAALDASPAQVVMIGNDRGRDVEGAASAGLQTIWVQHGAGVAPPGAVASLAAVAERLA